MVANIPEERLDELEQLWAEVNEFGPGLLPEEMEDLIKRCGYTPDKAMQQRLKKLVDDIDPDHAGYIDFYHFCKFVVEMEEI